MKLKEFFYLNKSDRSVLAVLLLVALCAMLIIYGLGNGNQQSERQTAYKDSVQRGKADDTRAGGQSHTNYQYDQGKPAVRLFPFDPNTADSTQLLALGLQPWQVRNIYKYRSKGGIYRKPADFARLYGLTVKQYKQLEPYIRISDDYRPAAELYAPERTIARHAADTLRYPVKLKPHEHISLNTADTTLLMRVPGIGSYYAREIVYYRQRLGGFCNVRQLLEIDGFPASSLPYFEVKAENITKMNVNELTLNQLKRHPYMGYYRAKEIVDYRRLKGPLQSLQDLKLLRDFTPDAIERLQPYVSF